MAKASVRFWTEPAYQGVTFAFSTGGGSAAPLLVTSRGRGLDHRWKHELVAWISEYRGPEFTSHSCGARLREGGS